jgi:choice-of-anchor B domain-containing protein
MKKIFTLAFLLIAACYAHAQYPAQNITMLSNWSDTASAEPTYHIRYSGSYGWAAPNGKEYAIIGSSSGTYFIDVTNPAAPVVCDYVRGRRAACIWREYRTYQNYCYMVSDDGAPNSFQIADMQYLPDSVHVVYDSNALFERSHTVYIEGNKLYCGSVTGPAGYYPMAVYSLANPAQPVLLRALNQDYNSAPTVHDMLVVNDTVYASSGYSGLYVYKFNGTNFTQISTLTSYPAQGYNHSTSITPDHKTMILCDEVPTGLAVKALDISDISNISVTSVFESNAGATPHNPYVIGSNRVLIAYYQDGVQIFDISDPANVVRTGFFDTDPDHGDNDGYPSTLAVPAYQGCWGAYTELPSGNIIAGDMQRGLFMLDITAALGVHDVNSLENPVTVYPNPFSTGMNVSITVKQPQNAVYEITDIAGRIIYTQEEQLQTGTNEVKIDTRNFSKGIYIMSVKGNDFLSTRKIVKSN